MIKTRARDLVETLNLMEKYIALQNEKGNPVPKDYMAVYNTLCKRHDELKAEERTEQNTAYPTGEPRLIENALQEIETNSTSPYFANNRALKRICLKKKIEKINQDHTRYVA